MRRLSGKVQDYLGYNQVSEEAIDGYKVVRFLVDRHMKLKNLKNIIDRIVIKV